MGGESTHVSAGLGQQRFSPALADSGNRVDLFYCATKRGGRNRPQPLACAGDLLFQKVVLPEQLFIKKR